MTPDKEKRTLQPETEEIRRKWRESSYYWNKHRNIIEQMFAPVTEALIEKARISAGDRVLDLAGGMGEPALSIARRYGDSVRITFTDVVQEMILAARSETRERENHWIQFCRCSGDELPFVDQSFNVIVSRFGIMFFPEPEKSLKHMLRVLNPGGRISVAVWHQLQMNPVHDFFMPAVEQFIPATPEPPDAPGPFRYAAEGNLANLLRSAGFPSVQEDIIDFMIKAPIGFEQFSKVRSEMSDTLRDKLAILTAKQRDRLYDDLRHRFKPYFISGEMRIPGKIIIVSGQKNSSTYTSM